MNKPKHSPEPWHLLPDDGGALTVMSGRRIVAKVYYHGGSEDPHVHENARRIVACVNACAGIEDPAAFIAKAKEADAVSTALKPVAHLLPEQATRINACLLACEDIEDPAAAIQAARDALTAIEAKRCVIGDHYEECAYEECADIASKALALLTPKETI